MKKAPAPKRSRYVVMFSFGVRSPAHILHSVIAIDSCWLVMCCMVSVLPLAGQALETRPRKQQPHPRQLRQPLRTHPLHSSQPITINTDKDDV